MNKTFICASICIFLAGCLVALGCQPAEGQAGTSGSDDKWHAYVSANKQMKLEFPAKPQVQEQVNPSAIGDLKMEIVSYEVNRKLAYTANSVTFPVDPSSYNVEDGLNGAVNAQKTATNEVISEKVIEKDGMPGRELIVHNKKDGLYLKTRCFVDGAGPSMYQVLVVGATKDSLETRDSNRFLDSLEIVKK